MYEINFKNYTYMYTYIKYLILFFSMYVVRKKNM